MSFGHQERISIAVVGAGLAGLTAAYRIQMKIGHPVAVYEARSRPGGRVHTARFGDSYEELGGKFISYGINPENITPLIAELGLSLESCQWKIRNRNFLFHGQSESMAKPFENGPRPDEEAFARLQSWGVEAQNLGEILDRFLQGHEKLRHLAEIWMRNFEGNDSRDLSTYYLDSFWGFYKANWELAQTKQDEPITIDYVQGGNSRLVERLEKLLKVPVCYDSPLTGISVGKQITLLFGGKRAVVDYLVLAIPCSTLRDLPLDFLPQDQQQAIRELQYGTNSKMLVPVQKHPQEPDMAWIENKTCWLNRDQSVLTIYSGGKAGYEMGFTWEEVQKIYPTLKPHSDLSPIEACWIREPYSKGSYSSWGVGQSARYEEKESVLGETVRKVFRPYKDKIFFAGEHAAIHHPATMEGAVESGERCSRMIIQVFKNVFIIIFLICFVYNPYN